MQVLPAGSFTAWWAKSATPADKKRYAGTIGVDMHHRGFSLEQPLFTRNVANCLVVAVNSTTGTGGTLAHVNITQSGFNGVKGFATVDGEMAAMTKSLGGKKAALEVLLWKGSGFTKDGNVMLKDGGACADDYAAHLGAAPGYAAVIDRIDKKRPYRTSGAVLFDPVRGIVYELSSEETEAVSLHLAKKRGNPAFDIAITRMKES